MAKSANQKTKLLRLAEMLLRKTDEDHPMTVQEIIRNLKRYDISAERKSIYDDLHALQHFGLDVQTQKGRSPGWFIGQRDFEVPELKLLMDAVQSSRFITQKKSDALIRKLEKLTSTHQAGQLQRQVYVSGRVKTMNESIYYNVDELHRAVAGGTPISFKYFDYDIARKKVYRKGGALYRVSPFGLIWSNENYYLVAFDHISQGLRHYRVDKMTDITQLTDEPLQGRDQYPDLKMDEYEQKHFGMFTGEDMQVTLRGERSMAHVLWDRFGRDIIMVPDGPDHFTTTIPVALSSQFFGWLFALDGKVTITAPRKAVDQYREKLSAALNG